MIAELHRVVVPALRRAGFKGAFPHLRRARAEAVDLITFQFDRHGGGLVVEIGRCPADGLTTYWGKHIAADAARAWGLDSKSRTRIQARPGSGTEDWFRFDSQSPQVAASQVLTALEAPHLWDEVIVGHA
jgi:hypothetical protein